MTDLSLPLCRASDPITSFEAADSAREFRHTHEDAIIEAPFMCGAAGVDDIAFESFLEPHAVGKRIAKLERDGRIVWTGEYVTSRSGHRQREWRIVDGTCDF
ncbi:MAG: hypothetical protein WC829_15325 [Hyphomicrobium sp.]